MDTTNPIRTAALEATLVDLRAARAADEAAFEAWLEAGQEEGPTLDAYAVAAYELTVVEERVASFHADEDLFDFDAIAAEFHAERFGTDEISEAALADLDDAETERLYEDGLVWGDELDPFAGPFSPSHAAGLAWLDDAGL